MATLTKSTGTVALSGAVEKVTLPAVYGWVWVKNMSEGDIFAGLSEDISEGADGVMVIPSGECGRIQADGFNSVYLLGTGNALVVAQNYADCPFKAGGKGGELPVASTDVLGGVMVDGTSITANNNGVISAVGGGNDWINVGAVNVSSSNVTFSIPNLSKYKLMMFSLYLTNSNYHADKYIRIFSLDDYKPISTMTDITYYIGNDHYSTGSSADDYFIGTMKIDKSTNKITFPSNLRDFYANIYMK